MQYTNTNTNRQIDTPTQHRNKHEPHTYTHTHTHTHTDTHTHTHTTHARTHSNIHNHKRTLTNAPAHAPATHTHTHTNTQLQESTHTNARAHTCARASHTEAHIHTHPHTNTHTRGSCQPSHTHTFNADSSGNALLRPIALAPHVLDLVTHAPLLVEGVPTLAEAARDRGALGVVNALPDTLARLGGRSLPATRPAFRHVSSLALAQPLRRARGQLDALSVLSAPPSGRNQLFARRRFPVQEVTVLTVADAAGRAGGASGALALTAALLSRFFQREALAVFRVVAVVALAYTAVDAGTFGLLHTLPRPSADRPRRLGLGARLPLGVKPRVTRAESQDAAGVGAALLRARARLRRPLRGLAALAILVVSRHALAASFRGDEAFGVGHTLALGGARFPWRVN